VARSPSGDDSHSVRGRLRAAHDILQVPIEDVVVGDEVLTHMGRWKPVEHIVVDTAPCVTVSGGGHRGLVMSDNHRMRVRYNRNPSGVKNLGHETWATPDNLEQAHYGSPTRFPSEPIPDGLSNPDGSITYYSIRVDCTSAPEQTSGGYLQRNAIFTACLDTGAACTDTSAIVRAQVNFSDSGSTTVQAWSVNG